MALTTNLAQLLQCFCPTILTSAISIRTTQRSSLITFIGLMSWLGALLYGCPLCQQGPHHRDGSSFRPSGMALLPGLDRHQLFSFVDQRKFKESVIAFLQNRKERRKQRVCALGCCLSHGINHHTRIIQHNLCFQQCLDSSHRIRLCNLADASHIPAAHMAANRFQHVCRPFQPTHGQARRQTNPAGHPPQRCGNRSPPVLPLRVSQNHMPLSLLLCLETLLPQAWKHLRHPPDPPPLA